MDRTQDEPGGQHPPGAAPGSAQEPRGSLEEIRNPGYEVFILGLTVVSLVNLAIALFARDPNIRDVVEIVDFPITLIFLIDFFQRLAASRPRRHYFIDQLGWLDLLGSLPFPGLRLFRVFRMVRVIRLLGAYGPQRVFRAFMARRAESALLVVIFFVIVSLETGAIFELWAERSSPDANIKTGGDALWWAFVSITTVGYGDRFPVTVDGRLVAVALLVLGVGLFGVWTGYLANLFVGSSSSEAGPGDGDAPADSNADTEADLTELRRLVEGLDAEVRSLRAALGAGTSREGAAPDPIDPGMADAEPRTAGPG